MWISLLIKRRKVLLLLLKTKNCYSATGSHFCICFANQRSPTKQTLPVVRKKGSSVLLHTLLTSMTKTMSLTKNSRTWETLSVVETELPQIRTPHGMAVLTTCNLSVLNWDLHVRLQKIKVVAPTWLHRLNFVAHVIQKKLHCTTHCLSRGWIPKQAALDSRLKNIHVS